MPMGAHHRALGLQHAGPPGCGKRQERNCPSPVTAVSSPVPRPPLPRARGSCRTVQPGSPQPAPQPGTVSPLPSQVPGAARCLRCGRWAGGPAAAHPEETDPQAHAQHCLCSTSGFANGQSWLPPCYVTSGIYRTPFPSSRILISKVGRGRTPTERSAQGLPGGVSIRGKGWMPGGYTISSLSFRPQGRRNSSGPGGRPHICFLPSSSPEGEGPALLHRGGKLRPKGDETCPR